MYRRARQMFDPTSSAALDQHVALWAETARARLPDSVRARGSVIEPAAGLAPGTPLVVYTPGRWCNSRLWATGDTMRDIRVALAAAGYVTATVKYRCSVAEHGTMPGMEIAAVTTQGLLEDIAQTMSDATSRYGNRPIVLCGFSMGAALAFMAAGAGVVRGLVAIDGGLPSATTLPREVKGTLENPLLHPRRVRSVLSRLTMSPGLDELRWSLTQDRLWPARQVEEMRSGLDDLGAPLAERLEAVTCPILCVSAGGRDPENDLRAERTAHLTSTVLIRSIRRLGWSHTDLETRRDADRGCLISEIAAFVGEAAVRGTPPLAAPQKSG
jgi:dienelactone hydrolase